MENNIAAGDIIKTQVGGPYKVISVKDNLVTFKMKNGIGMTITQHVTELIKDVEMNCEYSGLPSVKAYEK
jgi:hypothetical protein